MVTLKQYRLVLASQSPRRMELLRNAGFEFEVRAPEVDETPRPAEPPRDYAIRVACQKATAVPSGENEIILSADTVVVVNGEMLGKPSDVEEARQMLRKLSGRMHTVITAICLRAPQKTVTDLEETRVWFDYLTDQEIDEYVATGEPMDKAGGYAIQGLASKFIPRIEGCYFNVVGLPISLVYRRLKQLVG